MDIIKTLCQFGDTKPLGASDSNKPHDWPLPDDFGQSAWPGAVLQLVDGRKKWVDPPNYAHPAPPNDLRAKISCYLCGQTFDSRNRVNWQGHWICRDCFNKQNVERPEWPKEDCEEPAVFTKIIEEDKGIAGHDPTQADPHTYSNICCLCGHSYDLTTRVNWRGHWICPECCKERTVQVIAEKAQEFEEKLKQGLKQEWDKSDSSPLFKGTTAHAILHKAISTITQRGKDYNSPGGERSMRATVEAFNAIRGKDLTPEDGWAFMVCLKMVRAHKSPQKADHYTDGSAYFSLLGEEALDHEEP